MENKIFNTPQDEILNSLSINDYKDIKLSADDFSFLDSENMKEPNNNDRRKKNLLRT